MRTVVPCPDCGAPVPIPLVQIVKGDSADVTTIFCRNCMWTDSDEIFKAGHGRALVVWGGEEIVADARHPYRFVPVTEAASLNSIINGMTSGGVIWLEAGNYAAAGDLTITNSNISIWGVGRDGTIIPGSIDIIGNQIRIDNLWVKATGKSYGIKIFKTGAGPNRNEFKLVRVGGSVSTADGPSGPGVWIDGGILNNFDHCNISFNGGDGVYINTSQNTWSTNVNTFRDCTVNLNTKFGVKTEIGVDGIAGMQQNCFFGGNMEDNGYGVASINGSFYTRFDDVDFESSINLGTSFSVDHGGWLINGDSSTYIIVENCAFSSTGDTGRVFVFSTCGSCRFDNNRIRGQFPQLDVGVFDENCYRCTAHGNAFWDPNSSGVNPFNGTPDYASPRWINNRGQNRGPTA